MNTNNIVMWVTLQKQCRLGLFQDSDFAGDLEDSKSTAGRNIVHFWKSYICSNKLDVQETNFSFTQFNCGKTTGFSGKSGKVTQRSAWKDIANLRIHPLNNCTKSQLHVLTTINSKKKK